MNNISLNNNKIERKVLNEFNEHVESTRVEKKKTEQNDIATHFHDPFYQIFTNLSRNTY